MKKNFLILSIVAMSYWASAQSEFQKVYSQSAIDWGFASVNSGSGFVIAGYTISFGAGNEDVYLLSVNDDGDTLWTKSYGESLMDVATALQKTSDGGYIITGYSLSSTSGFDIYLIKTDNLGNASWTKKIGGSGDDFGYSVEQTSDGGYIIAGFADGTLGVIDVYLVKVDAIGTIIWEKYFGGASDDKAFSVHQTTDGGYIVGGFTKSFGIGDLDAYLFKTDSNGNLTWSKVLDGSNNDFGVAVELNSTGGYSLFGYGNSFSSTDFDAFIATVDSLGNSVWSKTYGNSLDQIGNYFIRTIDNGYAMVGNTQVSASAYSDIFLIKTDVNGLTSWSKVIGATNRDEAYFICQAPDQGFALGGYSDNFTSLNGDLYLIKTDSLGNSGCNESIFTFTETPVIFSVVPNVTQVAIATGGGVAAFTTPTGSGGAANHICMSAINTIDKSNRVLVYPNPFNTEVSILLENNENAKMVITDNLGRLVYSTILTEKKSTINTEKLERGIYFVNIYLEETIVKSKIVKIN